MGGCSSAQHVEEDVCDSTLAERSNMYERRIQESLHQKSPVFVGEMKQSIIDDMSTAASENDLSGACQEDNLDYEKRTETITFFDWDDTLFPTTWARKNFGFLHGSGTAPVLRKHDEARLKDLSLRLEKLLSQAKEAGRVVIVTNASRSWVAACCSKLMPEAQAILKQIPVIYAMELMSSCEAASLPTKVLPKESRARAIRKVLSTFHSSNSNLRGWINVVSIGDSDCGPIAIREFMRSKQLGKVACARCVTKSIKMFGSPSFMQMLLQLSAISTWFSDIAHVDTHVSIDLDKHA